MSFTAVALVLLPRATRAQLPAPPVNADSPLHLGGYGSVVMNVPGGVAAPRVTETSVALLATGMLLPRFGYFAEVDAVNNSRENYAGRQDDRRVELDRLYAEYTIADPLRIRVGRFLTPIGQWNEIHAEPLTWTAVRPLATYRPFATRATGAMIAGDVAPLGHDLGYAVWASLDRPPHDTTEVRFSRAVGARAVVELLPGVWVGGSASAVRERRPRLLDDDLAESEGETEAGESDSLVTEPPDVLQDPRTRALVGGDVRAEWRGAELLGEGVYLAAREGQAPLRGAFAQLALPVGLDGVRIVGRGEWFAARAGSTVRAATIGLAWRSRWITTKIERQLPDVPSPRVARGWYASVSLLF